MAPAWAARTAAASAGVECHAKHPLWPPCERHCRPARWCARTGWPAAAACRRQIASTKRNDGRRPRQLRGPGLGLGQHLSGQRQAGTGGTDHACQPRYAGRYLAEFSYRFNRRCQLADLVPHLCLCRTPPLRLLAVAGTAGSSGEILHYIARLRAILRRPDGA